MTDLLNGYQIDNIPGEEVFTLPSGRWQFVRLTGAHGRQLKRTYYHIDCDSVVDDEGRCILCRAKAWT